MVIEKGYKKSAMGIIPEDWHVKEFADVLEGFSSGQTPYRAVAEYYKGEIPWITSGELNYNVITDTIEKITIEGAREANLKMIPKGTFLFAITGLEAAGTRGSCAITGIEATTNQSCMALYPKRGLLITPYLYHFYVRYGNELAFKYCQGTKQQSYTGGIAKKLPIIVPPKIEEQTAIATALSDIDELISQTEKLIDKKKAIKQGVMQELLKPKEGWVTKKLGDVCDLKNGYAFKSETYDINGELSIITISNVQDGFLDLVDFVKISEPPIDLKEHHRLNIGDILISMTGNVGRICKVTIGNGLLNQRVGKLLPISIHPDFLFFYLLNGNFKKTMILNAVGGAQGNIGKGVILDFVIHCPLNVSDQENISKIVGDIYSEIETLESKLQKLKYQKQGMMQTLLTGKIRLI